MSSSCRRYIPEAFANGGMVKLPGAVHLEWIEVHMIGLLKAAGVDPAVIYAFETTTLWVTKANERTYTHRQLAQWDAAVASFSRKRTA